MNEFFVLVNITPGRSPEGGFLVSRRETMKLPCANMSRPLPYWFISRQMDPVGKFCEAAAGEKATYTLALAVKECSKAPPPPSPNASIKNTREIETTLRLPHNGLIIILVPIYPFL